MLFLRAVFLEILLCVHVIGAALLFRRLFPRESPWLCFVVPTLGLLSALNFIEYFVALPSLGWLLPLTLGGAVWLLLQSREAWEGMRFPTILFLATFTFIFALKCLSPDISNGNEGIFNLTRVLNYSLGGTLPPKDVFLPPYDYGGYYSFQHYGAAILKRLFSTDLGTAYNVSFAFLLTWLCLVGAGTAHSLSGRKWVAVATVLILVSASTGSYAYIIFFDPAGPDFDLSTNLNGDWDNPARNPFSWICSHDQFHPCLLLEAPLINLFWSEYHSTLGGNFITVATVLAASEVFRVERHNWSWICLLVLPMVVIVTSAWFFFIVVFLSAGSIGLALLAGRRPQDARFVLIASAVGMVLLWPFVYGVTGLSVPDKFGWTLPEEHTPVWMFLVQWWPVFLPWLSLLFIWDRLDLRSRWIHAALPLLFIFVELFTFGDRKLTTEKMWAGIYGAGLITLVPLVFAQRNLGFRLLSGCLVINALICLGQTLKYYYPYPVIEPHSFRLQGDAWVRDDPQKKRLVQVLRRLHGAVILPGKSYWDYSQAAAIVAFSENQCYVAYTYNEFHYGRGAEGDYRSQLNNNFYDGKNPDPLAFLRGNDINAVLIWPEDAVPDALLQQFKVQLDSEFFYIDCKMDGPNNAGVFFRKVPVPAFAGPTPSLSFHPN